MLTETARAEQAKRDGRPSCFLLPLFYHQSSRGGRGRPLTPRLRCQRTDPSTRAAPFSSSSLMLVIIASVVSIRPAIEAAFWRAERVTLVGSTIPAANMSTYSPVLALKPVEPAWDLTSSTTTPPSWPELDAMWRAGSSRA